MFNVATELNWWAVVLAIVAYFVLGALWFTPLFGRLYDSALGTVRQKNQSWSLIYYLGPFIGSVVVTLATAVLVEALDMEALSDALLFGLIAGVGYGASVSFTNAINPVTPRPLLYGAITGGYHVVGIVLVALILVGLN